MTFKKGDLVLVDDTRHFPWLTSSGPLMFIVNKCTDILWVEFVGGMVTYPEYLTLINHITELEKELI